MLALGGGRRRSRALQRAALLLLPALLVGTLLAPLTPARAANTWPSDDARFAARDAAFDRLDSAASLGNLTSHGQVVSAGHGVFHSIAVQSAAPPWHVVYQRSTDGGLTWDHQRRITKDAVTSDLLGYGDIAVSGDHVAIAYLGAAHSSDPEFAWASAVFLIESHDAGVSWSLPRQIGGGMTTQVQVAVDGDRTWVAYDLMNLQTYIWRSDGPEVHTCGGDPQVAAQGGTVAVTAICDGVLSAAVGQGDQLGAFTNVVAKPQGRSMVVNGLAVADGTAQILVSNLRRRDGGDDVTVGVWHASPGEDFALSPLYDDYVPDQKGDGGAEIELGSDTTARIAAGRGTVAVTVVPDRTHLQLYTSTDQGSSFTGPTLVDVDPSASGMFASVAVSVPEPESALPRFSWKVDPHYVDSNGDGLPEPANISGDAGADSVRVGADRSMTVHLDGCASLPPATGVIATYTWKIGEDVLASGSDCRTDLDLQSGQTKRVRLVLTMADGTKAATEQDVAPRDLVIASLGDGWASGDGDPDRADATSPGWDDAACHRSAHAGPAQAAAALEEADDHTSVTFIQLACTGAALLDTTDDPASTSPAADDLNDGGVLDAYAGGDPDIRRSRPSQLDDLATMLGTRTVDAVMISAGAGDIRVRQLMDECAHNQPFGYCQAGTLAAQVPTRIGQLPGRFAQVADRLSALGVQDADVLLTEYADPTTDEHGLHTLLCPGGGVSTWMPDEAEALSDHVITPLNAKLADIAGAHHWTWVGGISQQFDRHGYCADDPWVVRAPESQTDQGDDTGTYLPNHAGQAVYAAALGERLDRSFLTTPAIDLSPGQVDPVLSGDISIVYGDGAHVYAVPVASTGEAPVLGDARLVESAHDTDDATGWVTGADAAMDAHASVAVVTDEASYTWSPADADDGRSTNITPQVTVMQTAVRPNLSVDDVRAVQGPDDATTLVAGRPTLLQARISASLAHQGTADLTVTVDALDTSGGVGRTLIDHEQMPVIVKPGSNTVLLPLDRTFTLNKGERIQATVSLEDPPGARSIDDVDNSFTLDHTSFHDTAQTRRLRVDFGPVAGPGVGQTPSCGFVSDLAADSVAFADQAMPVASAGISPYLSCDPFTVPDGTTDPLDTLLFRLDSQARESALDSVVGVVDPGWMAQIAGPGVAGVASIDGRAILISAERVDPEVLAHELGHNLGLGHTDGQVAAHGWRVDLRAERGGVDWMDVETHPKVWTSGATWDALVQHIGGPEAAPQPMVPTLDGRWVRGYVSPDGDVSLGPMLSDTSAATAPADGSDTSRLKMYPIDADGNVIEPTVDIGLSPVDTSGAGATGSFTFAQRIVPPAGAVSLRFELDGHTVATRQLGAPPVVSVTAPTAGATTGRGEQLDVAWTISDPDSSDFDTNLLVSEDDGDTWRPLSDAIAHNATSASVTVPADLDGDHVRIRVVVTDGSSTTWADSGTITVGAGSATQRVAFVRDLTAAPGDQSLIGTMAPDGSDAKTLDLPAGKYGAPVWDPQTGRLFMLGDSQSSSQCDVYSVNNDGSALRQEDLVHDYYANRCGNSDGGKPDTDYGTGGCLQFSANGQRLMVDRQVFERDASGVHWSFVGGAGDSSGWNVVGADTGTVPPGGAAFAPQSGSYPIACSSLSPDGTRSVTPVISYGTATDAGGASYSAVGLDVVLDQDVSHGATGRFLLPFDAATVAPYDGPAGMVQQATPPGSLGVTWLDDHHVVVVAGSPEWDHAKLTKVDVDTGETTDLGNATIGSQTHTLQPWTVTGGRQADPYGNPKIAPDGSTLYGDSVSGTSCVGSMWTVPPSGGAASVISPARVATPPDGGGGDPTPTHQGIRGTAFAATDLLAYPVVDGQVSADYLARTSAEAGTPYELELPEGDYLIRWYRGDTGSTWYDGSRWGTTSENSALLTGVVHVSASTWVEDIDYGNPADPLTVDPPHSDLSGTISYHGTPLPGADVEIRSNTGDLTTTTDSSGRYEFPAVTPGSWTMSVSGLVDGDYVGAYYGPSPMEQTSTPIVVDRSGAAISADLDIPTAFPALTGRQAAADGSTFSSQVALFDADTKKEITRVYVGDTWSLPVAPGRYLLAWSMFGSLYFWTGRSQEGTTSKYNATPIVVTDHDVTGLTWIDTSLPAVDPGPPLTGIGGHVYDAAGHPLAGDFVQVRRWSSAPGQYGETIAAAATAADGSWSVPLDPGVYRVEFTSTGAEPWAGGTLAPGGSVFWTGTTRWNWPNLNGSAPITIADGQFLDTIDHGDPALPIDTPATGTTPVDASDLCQSGFAWGLTKLAGSDARPLGVDVAHAAPDDNAPSHADAVITYDAPAPDLSVDTVAPSLDDLAFTMAADQPTEITLTAHGGATLPFRVTGAPSAVQVSRATASTDPDGKVAWTTGPDGRLAVTAAAGDYDLRYAVPGLPGLSAHLRLHVVAPPKPVVGDDTLTAHIGEDSTFPVADLLGNDHAGADGTLHLVTVGGYTAGSVYLDGDTVHVRADADGGTFRYTVAEGASTAYATGTVTVHATGSSPSPTPTTGPTSGPAPAPTPGDSPALTCSGRGAILFSVVRTGRFVVTHGQALLRYAGQTVRLRRHSASTTLATARVGADGTFTARWRRLPGDVLYEAVLPDGRTSRPHRAAENITVLSITGTGTTRTVTLKVPASLQPGATAIVRRLIGCAGFGVIGRARVSANHRVVLMLPAVEAAAASPVYQVAVRKRARLTFVLPRG